MKQDIEPTPNSGEVRWGARGWTYWGITPGKCTGNRVVAVACTQFVFVINWFLTCSYHN